MSVFCNWVLIMCGCDIVILLISLGWLEPAEQLLYSKTVDLSVADQFANLTPLAEGNHMYIRIASNDFFSASRDVVQKMITGEYNAQEAYEAFDAQLREPKDVSADVVLTSENAYSNVFYSRGGNEAYSVMANTLRNCYTTCLLLWNTGKQENLTMRRLRMEQGLIWR